MQFGRFACLSVFLVLASPSLAADNEQVKLSPQTVERFLQAHDELEALARSFATRYGDRSDAEGDDPVAALPAFQDVPEARGKTSQILVKYGFADLDDWERVTNSVLLAYQYTDPAATPPDPEVEKAKARAEIEKPNMRRCWTMCPSPETSRPSVLLPNASSP
jgi:hypothetical protein